MTGTTRPVASMTGLRIDAGRGLLSVTCGSRIVRGAHERSIR